MEGPLWTSRPLLSTSRPMFILLFHLRFPLLLPFNPFFPSHFFYQSFHLFSNDNFFFNVLIEQQSWRLELQIKLSSDYYFWLF